MSDILPEQTDESPVIVSPLHQSQPSHPQNKRTLYVLVALVVIAILSLVGGYIYDVNSNNSYDNTRKQDLSYIASTLEGYHELYKYYPTLEQINSSTFSAFAPSLDHSKFKDPTGDSSMLSSGPAANIYAYEVQPAGCNNTTLKCTSYKLVATLSSGKQYVIVSNPSTNNQPVTIK